MSRPADLSSVRPTLGADLCETKGHVNINGGDDDDDEVGGYIIVMICKPCRL